MKGDHNDAEDFSSDDEDVGSLLIRSGKKSNTPSRPFGKEDDDEEISEQSESEQETIPPRDLKENKQSGTQDSLHKHEDESNPRIESEEARKKAEKLNRVNKLKLTKKSKHKTGVVYLSTIPPYMKPTKMRQILSRFGEVDRLFLKREDEKAHKQRVRSRGNKKVMYVEGWAEFIRKRDAKLCAETLNGNTIGGKKGSFYHDDIMNLKYLPGFKWADLTDQIARENDIRQSKLDMEISQANKLNAEFTRNVEKSKMLQNMKSSKKRKNNGDDPDQVGELHRRNFKQHRVASSRANAPSNIKNSESSKDLGSVLSNLL
ncbi:BN860_00606g1_1 [Zygosaccharomyces bailii CLIB 213]|uniref:Pre-rRNA-processing protein ESF2 n=1 Tax=Zygosaccharomyces bailii (strain CLIB 213 / ATCC 58445 / CBS 680 / BCRC 21525 / NBRC 1098 / NCYC 1416 / NRRL Y-2227) TaxID=1333698 RepID=A0A8J2X8T0_ZYGB2|nr:BN860_00606g1_1 [Zygosaccharomyces bailii CLIB 213]